MVAVVVVSSVFGGLSHVLTGDFAGFLFGLGLFAPMFMVLFTEFREIG